MKYGDRVRIVNTSNKIFDDKTGMICGRATTPGIINQQIVRLDDSIVEIGDEICDSIILPEIYLEKISWKEWKTR